MSTKGRTMIKRATSGVLVVLAALAVLVIPATLASAAPGGPGIGVGIGTPGTGGGGNLPEPGPLTPRPKPPAVPAGTEWFSSSSRPDPWCDRLADGRAPVLYAQRWLAYVGTNGKDFVKSSDVGFQTSFGWCTYYPVEVIEDEDMVCPVRITGDIVGPTGNPNVGSRTIREVDRLSPWQTGGRVSTDCSAEFSEAINANVADEGWYDAKITMTTVTCPVRSFSGTQAPEVRRSECGPEVPVSINRAITVSCTLPGGWVTGKVAIRAFGADACRDQGPQFWSCAPSSVSFDGQPPRGTVQSFDDGKHRLARWSPLGVNNVRGINDVQTRIAVDSRGTPYRAGASANAGSQPQVIATGQGGAPIGLSRTLTGDQTSLWMGWQQSSQPGNPSVTNRTVAFDAQFPTTQVTIQSMDLLTGNITATSTVIYVNGTGTCPSAPLSVDVLRARNTN